MGAGRPRKADAAKLYGFAHQFYWDLKVIQEGQFRTHTDWKKFEHLKQKAETAKLSREQVSEIDRLVDDRIREGSIRRADRNRKIRELQSEALFRRKIALKNMASRECSHTVRVPGEPDVIEALLSATSPEEIAKICNEEFTLEQREIAPGIFQTVQDLPISSESILPKYLSQYAAEFIEAKHDSRYPKSSRPSTRLKQFWFLARALAGAVLGVQTRTAINVLGSMSPDQMMDLARSGKRKRKKKVASKEK